MGRPVSLTTAEGQSRLPGKSEKVILKKFVVGIRSSVPWREEARIISQLKQHSRKHGDFKQKLMPLFLVYVN